MRKYINLKKKSNGTNLIFNEFSPESLGMYNEKKKHKQRRILVLDLPVEIEKSTKMFLFQIVLRRTKKKFRFRESVMNNDEMSHNSNEKSLGTVAYSYIVHFQSFKMTRIRVQKSENVTA
jgi:hypothetical protein